MNDENNKNEPYKDKKVLLVSCEECGFAIIFIHDNRHFFYCKKDRAGANLADSQKAPLCSICKEPAERYDLAEEDNFCPICQHGYLSVMYGDKQFSKEEAAALYKKAQQAEEENEYSDSDDENDDSLPKNDQKDSEPGRLDPNQISFLESMGVKFKDKKANSHFSLRRWIKSNALKELLISSFIFGFFLTMVFAKQLGADDSLYDFLVIALVMFGLLFIGLSFLLAIAHGAYQICAALWKRKPKIAFRYALIAGVTLISVGVLFYWYHLRPAEIRKACAAETIKDSLSHIASNNQYRYCLTQHGMRPESLYVNLSR